MRTDQKFPRRAAARSAPYVLVLFGLTIFACSVAVSVAKNLDFPWTSIRLAPAFALAQGLPLYSMPNKPPWVMVGYGPLYPLAYLPATVAHHPRTAVTIATLLAHFYVLAPVGLLCSLFGRNTAREPSGWRPHWTVALVLFALITHLVPSLTYAMTGVHADAPAFGLLLLGCYAVLRAEMATEAAKLRWLLAASVAVGLSAACKINFAAGGIALLIWVLRFFGVKRALIFFSAALLAAAGVYGLAAFRDGFAAVALNLGQPAKMPWFTFGDIDAMLLTGNSHEFSEKVRTFLTFGRDYLKAYGVVALAVVVVTATRNKGETSSRASRLVWFFLFMAIFLAPGSIASISKYGGDVNSRALVSLPLALAAIFALISAARDGNRAAAGATFAALIGATIMVALPLKDGPGKIWPKNAPTLVEAYSVIAADPSRWYFPFDPLAHLLAEGKFRPSMDVVYSYAVCDFPVDENAFHSAIPENLRYIAIPPTVAGWGVSEIRRLLPEYNRAVPELNFARHRVYGR